MIGYTGNGAYCFTNSLHMCLRAAGAEDWVTPGLLEALSGMAFGAGHYRFGALPEFYPNAPNIDPDTALDHVIALLGWTCTVTRGGDAESALDRLRTTPLPVQVGPLDYGELTYHPNRAYMRGSDHYVTVLAIEDDTVRVHDPGGHPFATLPLADFLTAWRADRIDYGPDAGLLQYVLRANFHRVESVRKEEAIQRGVEAIRKQTTVTFAESPRLGGAHAFQALAEDVGQPGMEGLHDLLVHFSLPLGARRCTDAALFLAEAGLNQASACMERKARLYGESLYNAVHQQWEAFATQMQQLAETEDAFTQAMKA